MEPRAMRKDHHATTSCEGCGERIGVYEPALVEHAGWVVETSLLVIAARGGREATRAWHAACRGRRARGGGR
jgi:hypothetical protein